jgi:acetylornithine deacetylase/succinyl-diaminopimelate desuccinylase-like protein
MQNFPSRRVFLFRLAAVAPVLAALLFAPLRAADLDVKSAAVVERMQADLKYLASDELEGRGVGTQGLNKAADYIRDQFKKAGLDVTRVDGGAYHTFKMSTGTKLGKNNTLTFLGKDGKRIELKYDVDYRTCSFGRSGKFDGGIVFLGYGIHAPQMKYSDFEGVDLKGKVAVIMRRTPQEGNPHSPFNGGRNRTNYGSLIGKYREAFSRGAAAVLLVNDPYSTKQEARRRTKVMADAKDAVVKAAEELEAAETAKPKDAKKIAAARKKLSQAVNRIKNVRKIVAGNVDELFNFGYGGNTSRGKDPQPIFQITQAACDRLLKAGLGKSLEELEAAIDKDGKPHSVPLAGWTGKGQVSVEPEEEQVKNVIGVLEGDGPLAEETIVIGAHYDHVGRGKYGSRTPGEIHNGADDNASGTVSLIELARRLASRKQKLPRRVVFIAFTAEELGLIGSAKYAEKPLYPLKNTVAMFNMDMVGRLKDGKLTIFCVGSSPRWKPLLEKHGNGSFKLALRNEMFGRSDHASFARKGVPAIHFFTNTHGDYHRPTDDWQKVNFEGMAGVVDYIEKVVLETVATKERPKFTKPPEPKRRRRSSPGAMPYFGSQPDYAKQVDGVYISGATKGSPAEKAGLKAGDVIVKLGRFKISSVREYADALTRYKAGDTVDVQVKRGGKTVTLKATLDKPR